MLKRAILVIIMGVLLVACSEKAKEEASRREWDLDNNKKQKDFILELYDDPNKEKYIVDFYYEIPTGPSLVESLKIYTSEHFKDMSLSDQLSASIDLYNYYIKKISDTSYTHTGIITTPDLAIYVDADNEFPTYFIDNYRVDALAELVSFKNGEGGDLHENAFRIIDLLDKESILSGTYSGLNLEQYRDSEIEELFESTTIHKNGEVDADLLDRIPKSKRAHFVEYDVLTDIAASKQSASTNDTETYVDGKTRYDWVSFSDNQKFHSVSNALYSLDLNGYIILETEDYYINALNEYYNISSTMGTAVDIALASVGIISGTMTK